MTQANQIAASFISATLAPVGSITRVAQAETWIGAAMYRVDDAAVAYGLSALRGWETLSGGSPAARKSLSELIGHCESYLADATSELSAAEDHESHDDRAMNPGCRFCNS